MKKFVFLVFGVLVMLLSSCSKCNLESQIASAYIVSDSTVTIVNVRVEDVHRPVYPGGYYQVLAVHYAEIKKSLASEAYRSNIVKPGLDFSIFSGGWGANSDNMIVKNGVMHNAIYIEKNGTINSVKNLYINGGSIINYRIVNRILYIKKLTPVEAEDLEEGIKKRIRSEIFIY